MFAKIEQTCFACPSQWDAVGEDGVRWYIRFRWGCFTAQRMSPDTTEGYGPDIVSVWDPCDGWAGEMDTEEMLSLLLTAAGVLGIVFS